MKYRIEKAAAEYHERFEKNLRHPFEGAFYDSDINEVLRLAKEHSNGNMNTLLFNAILISLNAGFMIGYKKGRRDSNKSMTKSNLISNEEIFQR